MIFSSNLKPGTSFGELALRFDKQYPDKVVKRQASICTTTDSVFALVEKKDYRNILDKIETKKLEATVAFFRQIPYLKHMGTRQVRGLHFIQPTKYNLNQVVV